MIDGHDYVLIDSPPLTCGADSYILAMNLDAVLVVVRYGKTTKRALQSIFKELSRLPGIHKSVILNQVDLNKDGYYYPKGYYHSHYHNDHHTDRNERIDGAENS